MRDLNKAKVGKTAKKDVRLLRRNKLSLKRLEIRVHDLLLLTANKKTHTGFRLVKISMTLNDLELKDHNLPIYRVSFQT